MSTDDTNGTEPSDPVLEMMRRASQMPDDPARFRGWRRLSVAEVAIMEGDGRDTSYRPVLYYVDEATGEVIARRDVTQERG